MDRSVTIVMLKISSINTAWLVPSQSLLKKQNKHGTSDMVLWAAET